MVVSLAETGPILLPGTCVNCGSGPTEDRIWFALGFRIDFYGEVYLCSFCIQDIKTLFGTEAEVAELQEKIQELELQNAAGNAAISFVSGLRDYIAAVDTFAPKAEPVAAEGSNGPKEPASK